MKTLILALTLLLSISTKSQVQYLFGYDAAGNRISRMGIILNKTTQNVDTTGNVLSDSCLYNNEAKQQYQANIEDYVITVYPNPTTGELKIDISNFEEGTKGSIFITDIQGKYIYKTDVIYDKNIINLNYVASGQYLMRIVLNNKNHEFFVFKE
jgi:hypothetical protein